MSESMKYQEVVIDNSFYTFLSRVAKGIKFLYFAFRSRDTGGVAKGSTCRRNPPCDRPRTPLMPTRPRFKRKPNFYPEIPLRLRLLASLHELKEMAELDALEDALEDAQETQQRTISIYDDVPIVFGGANRQNISLNNV